MHAHHASRSVNNADGKLTLFDGRVAVPFRRTRTRKDAEGFDDATPVVKLLRDMRAIWPSIGLTILLEDRLDADPLAAIATATRTQPGVIEAAARAQFTLQVQQDGRGWGPNPLRIFVAAPDDPMRIENLQS